MDVCLSIYVLAFDIIINLNQTLSDSHLWPLSSICTCKLFAARPENLSQMQISPFCIFYSTRVGSFEGAFLPFSVSQRCRCVSFRVSVCRALLIGGWKSWGKIGGLCLYLASLSPHLQIRLYTGARLPPPDTGARFRSAHYPPLQGSTRL